MDRTTGPQPAFRTAGTARLPAISLAGTGPLARVEAPEGLGPKLGFGILVDILVVVAILVVACIGGGR